MVAIFILLLLRASALEGSRMMMRLGAPGRPASSLVGVFDEGGPLVFHSRIKKRRE